VHIGSRNAEPNGIGLSETRRAILKQLAWDGGLDVDLELIAPSDNNEAAHAFHLVTCGADLLIGFADPERFPSANESVRERGASAMIERAATPQDCARPARMFSPFHGI